MKNNSIDQYCMGHSNQESDLLKEIRDKKISNKDVRVIYVYMENKQSKIQDLTINENGSFGSKWKDGFFTEKIDLL